MIIAALITSIWPLSQLYYLKASAKVIQFNEEIVYKERSFSIVIAIKNEPIEVIRGLVENLLNLNYENYEILIISDDDKNYFNKLISEIPFSPKLRIVRREKPLGKKAGALNFAINLTRGEYLVFLDAEARIDKDFLYKVNSKIRDGAAFRLKLRNNDFPLGKLYEATMEFTMNSLFKGRYVKGMFIIPNGSAFAIRKDLLIKVGGWRENLFTEDLELGIRLALYGVKIDYFDDVIVYTLSPYNEVDLYRQIERWSYGSAQLLKECLSLLKLGIKGFDAFLYAQQWGFYTFFVFILIVVSALQPILMISIWSYLTSFLIFGLVTGLYVSQIKSMSDPLAGIVTYFASLIGYIKGILRIKYEWKVTPKVPRKSEANIREIDILIYILLLLSFLDVMFKAYFPSLILLGLALVGVYFNYIAVF